jgi:uncharacterized protein YndB with AHSA1/START domain
MDNFTIEKEIFINASPELVFDMLTNSAQVIKYFPLKEVVSEWKVGSEVLYKGEVDNKSFTDYGVIDVISRPDEYKYTYWSDNHGTDRTPENHLSIRYKLSKEGKGTKLELVQSNLRSKEMFQMMDATVWDFLLNNMKNHIESNA